MPWKMELCTSRRDGLFSKIFENFEDGVDWLRIYHPSLLAPEAYRSVIGDDFRQFGTNYYWASFRRVNGCCETCAGTGIDSSSPETNGQCWECRSTGHNHAGPCA